MSDHIVPHKTYYQIFAALIVLTVVTATVSYVELGFLNVPLALAIALTKAVLVLLFFMHVRYSSRLVWVFAAAGFFWLFILIGLTLSDYMSRGWEGVPLDPTATLLWIYPLL
ncbi:MAG: cytochrome C oxidase subunit IV family protein [Acidobacteriota bacterium]